MEKLAPVASSPLDSFRGRRPVVQAVRFRKARTCWKYAVCCPFCNSEHLHGGGPLDALPDFGVKVSHCLKGTYFIQPPESAVVLQVQEAA